MSEIKTLSSDIVYSNKWMTVREDKIKRASGTEGIYGVVDKPDAAVIIPIDNDSIYLVEQYRYSVGKRYWELPQGAWESNPDADSLTLAKGELQEETGLIAHKMVYVATQYFAYGFLNQRYHIYIAKGLSQGVKKLDVEEEGLISKKFSLDAFEQMIKSGEIMDATTVNAYGLAKLKGML